MRFYRIYNLMLRGGDPDKFAASENTLSVACIPRGPPLPRTPRHRVGTRLRFSSF